MIHVRTEHGTETFTDEEYVERFGEQRHRLLTGADAIPESELTPGQKLLRDRMQAPFLDNGFWEPGVLED